MMSRDEWQKMHSEIQQAISGCKTSAMHRLEEMSDTWRIVLRWDADGTVRTSARLSATTLPEVLKLMGYVRVDMSVPFQCRQRHSETCAYGCS